MKFVKLTGVFGEDFYVSPTMIIEPARNLSTADAKTRITCAGSMRFSTDAVEDVVAKIEATIP
jgi:hypothetical protein